MALLHKLTRTDDAGIRGRILRHYMAPQTSVKLPDGTEMPLNPPAPATVTPMVFAEAVEGALNKVLAMSVDRRVLEATAEDIRSVAKVRRRLCEVDGVGGRRGWTARVDGAGGRRGWTAGNYWRASARPACPHRAHSTFSSPTDA